jgi:hypothetical protein
MKFLPNESRSGSTLVVVMVVMFTLIVIVAVSAEYTMTISRNVQRTNTFESAIAIGDGCIDWNFAYWRALAKATTPPSTDTLQKGIPLPTASLFPTVSNFSAAQSTYNPASTTTVQQCAVVALTPEWVPMASITSTPTPQIGQSATSVTYNYLATAYVTLPAVSGNLTAKVQRIFQKQQLSPWNWAIFYNDPLEIHPGPIFNVTGWVHTNSDLYTAHDTLYFQDKVTYGSSWNIAFMPGDGAHTTETPAAPHYLSNSPPSLDTQHDPFDVDSSVFNTTDTNPNNDGYHELIDPPNTAYSDPLSTDRYYDQATVVITVDASNNVTIQKNVGGTLTTLSALSTNADLSLYNMISSAITTGQTIQDNREGAQVRLTTLNVGAMTSGGNWKSNSAAKSFNFTSPVIYIYDKDSTASARRGIRIINGSYIPSGGITVASANPVYVQGDFNVGTGSPPSNSGDPTTPQVSGYTRQGCSILADAISVLSNSWNDSNAASGLGSRVATNTTVNAAFVSGVVPTANGNYSGGAENFPRFLEDWSAATLTYYGSMVELFSSQQSTGIWGKANVYNPPTRQWYFDTNFKTTPPPGTLMTYSYIKGRWSLAP